MNICIPVTADEGLASRVNAHFGSTPLFLVVNTETGECRAVPNRNQHHGHGMCQPLAALAGEPLDGIVVGGIGRGALDKLRAAGLRVYLTAAPTVEATVAALAAGTLREVDPSEACAHHGDGPHGHGAHGHGPHGGRLEF